MPQILINREPLRHLNFDVELLGDCDVIVNELCHWLGGHFTELCTTTLPATEISTDDVMLPAAVASDGNIHMIPGTSAASTRNATADVDDVQPISTAVLHDFSRTTTAEDATDTIARLEQTGNVSDNQTISTAVLVSSSSTVSTLITTGSNPSVTGNTAANVTKTETVKNAMTDDKDFTVVPPPVSFNSTGSNRMRNAVDTSVTAEALVDVAEMAGIARSDFAADNANVNVQCSASPATEPCAEELRKSFESIQWSSLLKRMHH